MSEMIERVARAIFEAWRTAKGAEGTWDEALRAHAAGQASYPTAFEYVELARAEARAAIRAMREPNAIMVASTAHVLDAGPHRIWRAMIDAALGDPPHD